MYTRMGQLDRAGRLALTAAAHATMRGRAVSLEERIAIAHGVQRKLTNVSRYEVALCNGLLDRGINPVQQLACGPYNVDVAIGSVAVEVLGGAWHRSKPHGQRIRYLLDSGFDVLYIWSAFSYRVTSGTAEHVIAFMEETSRNPAGPRRYRVIRGNGHLVAEFQADRDEIPDIVPISDRPETEPASVPHGFCHCGCGRTTPVAKTTRSERGVRKGEHLRYISGHNHARGRR